ncbi:MAG: DUF637 domain-containing protein [Zoogloea sp.]|uniref:DUF637 domain-containing protein n=1 Tax=Zoogloea sp. TaxID=49181 RepID=UPI002629A7D1|nr:DUF637 domain-containing protein [Zoogloea sp.]MDD2991177.1 DUF637 domain-containing protein [Zoogloea sp.]
MHHNSPFPRDATLTLAAGRNTEDYISRSYGTAFGLGAVVGSAVEASAASAAAASTTATASAVASTAAGSAAASAAAGAATTAGLTTLAAQATVSLINNKGNLGKTLSDLGREEALRSVATAMVTAGALSALAGSISVPNADGGFTPLANVSAKSDLVAQIGKNVINNTASAIIDTAINGGDLGDKLGRAITTGVIDAAGASAANSVGDLSGFSNRMGHLVVGCALGAAKGGDCGSGAIGGLAGELAAEWYGGNREPVSATQASRTVDVARLFGALAATLVGGDAQVGASAAGNAAQNNWLNHIEARQLSQAKEKLQACQSTQCRSEAQAEIKTLEARDKARNEALAAACTAPTSTACAEQRRQVTVAAASYVGQSDGLDLFGVIGKERSESQTLATQYNLRSSNAGAYNTLTGAAQSVVGGVVGAAELTVTMGLAAAGDPQAQAQLGNLAKGLGNFLAHPIDATEALISNTLAQANALEAQGKTDEATQLRAKLFTDGVLTVSGAGAVVAKVGGKVVGNVGAGAKGVDGAARSGVADNVWHSTEYPSAVKNILEYGIDQNYLNPNSRFGKAFYVAEEPGTSIAEMNHYGVDPFTGIRFSIDHSRVKLLDLTNPDVAMKWGYSGGEKTAQMKQLADQAKASGYNAIRFVSERTSDGVNIAVLSDFNEVLKPQMIAPVKE